MIYSDAGRLKVTIADGTTAVTVQSGALTAGIFYNFVVTFKPGATARIYTNGALSNSGSTAGISGSLSNSINLTIGAYSGGNLDFTGRFAGCAIWTSSSADWLGSDSETLNAAKQLHVDIVGFRGRAVNPLPDTFTTTTNVTSQVLNSAGKLEWNTCLANWPVCVHYPREDSGHVFGYLPHTQITSNSVQPTDMSNAAWTKTNTTISGSTAGPMPGTTLDGVVASGGDVAHNVRQFVTTTAATYTFGVVAKKGEVDYLFLENGNVVNTACYFNLDTGTVHSEGSAATAHIWAMANDTYFCCITHTATASSNLFRYAPSSSGSDGGSYAGHETNPEIYAGHAWAVQWYWPLPWFSGTMGISRIQYPVANIPDVDAKQATLAFEVLVPNGGDVTPSSYVLTLSDGAVSDQDCIRAYVTSGEKPGCLTAEQGNAFVATNGDTSVNDGLPHDVWVRCTEGTKSRVHLDGQLDKISTSDEALPDQLDRLLIGSTEALVTQGCFPVWNLRVGQRYMTP